MSGCVFSRVISIREKAPAFTPQRCGPSKAKPTVLHSNVRTLERRTSQGQATPRRGQQPDKVTARRYLPCESAIRSHTGSDTACCSIPGRQTSARKAKCCHLLDACCTLGPLRPSSDLHSSAVLVMPTFQMRKPRHERRSELCKLLQE